MSFGPCLLPHSALSQSERDEDWLYFPQETAYQQQICSTEPPQLPDTTYYVRNCLESTEVETSHNTEIIKIFFFFFILLSAKKGKTIQLRKCQKGNKLRWT